MAQVFVAEGDFVSVDREDQAVTVFKSSFDYLNMLQHSHRALLKAGGRS
jgi:hypothetical protein